MSPDWRASAALGSDAALVRAAVVVAALLLVGPLLRLLLAALSALPGRFGRVAAVAGAAVRPGIVRRTLAVVIGLGLPVASTLVSAPAAQAHAVDLVGPVRPVPAPQPGAPVATTPDAVVVVRPGDTLWDIARRHLPVSATAADVARAWPRWYAVNRTSIGPDPSMLRPGTRLRSPDHRSAGTPGGMHHSPRTTPDSAAATRAWAQSLDPDRR
jgi:hypothetical protein